jgi:hypothetical protein
MQRSVMKKILGKFKKSTFAYFFALDRESSTEGKK